MHKFRYLMVAFKPWLITHWCWFAFAKLLTCFAGHCDSSSEDYVMWDYKYRILSKYLTPLIVWKSNEGKWPPMFSKGHHVYIYTINMHRICTWLECWIFTSENWAKLKTYLFSNFQCRILRSMVCHRAGFFLCLLNLWRQLIIIFRRNLTAHQRSPTALEMSPLFISINVSRPWNVTTW